MSCRWCGKSEAEHTEPLGPDDPLPWPFKQCRGERAHYFEAPDRQQHKPTEMEYRVHKVQLLLCEACLAGLGNECNTPACALCRHNSPGSRIFPELYEIVEHGPAEGG